MVDFYIRTQLNFHLMIFNTFFLAQLTCFINKEEHLKCVGVKPVPSSAEIVDGTHQHYLLLSFVCFSFLNKELCLLTKQ